MAKKDFERIKAGLEDALAIAEGRAEPGSFRVHIPAAVDVKAIRKQLGLTQDAFAARYGFSLGQLRDWEQKRSDPAPSQRILLKVIERDPAAVERVLESA